MSPIQGPICFLLKLIFVKFVNFLTSVGIVPKNSFLPTSLNDRLQEDRVESVKFKQRHNFYFEKLLIWIKSLDKLTKV